MMFSELHSQFKGYIDRAEAEGAVEIEDGDMTSKSPMGDVLVALDELFAIGYLVDTGAESCTKEEAKALWAVLVESLNLCKAMMDAKDAEEKHG